MVIDINAALTVDFSLSLGSASETVSVNDVTPLINTENQEIGSVRLPEQIQNLPVIVREVQTLIGQTPGVPYGTGSKTSSDTDTIGGTFSQGRERFYSETTTDQPQLERTGFETRPAFTLRRACHVSG